MTIMIPMLMIYFFLLVNRNKCTVVYPPGLGNKIQFIAGIGIPASNLPTTQSVSWGYVIKTNFPLPTNLSMYSDPPPQQLLSRQSKSITRSNLYTSIEHAIDRAGLPGKECLMRTICDASSIRFDTDNIIGTLLHIILQPSTTESPTMDYHEAQIIGKLKSRECSVTYKRCPLSILDLFTIVEDSNRIKARFEPDTFLAM